MTTRRMLPLVIAALLLVMPAVLVACGDDDDTPETSMQAGTTVGTTPGTGPVTTPTDTPRTTPSAPSTTTADSSTSTSYFTGAQPDLPPGDDGSNPPIDGSATTPQDAVALWVIGQGMEYAGDCATTSIDTDIGKMCSVRYAQMANGDEVFQVGPTFSEFTTYLLVQLQPGGWVVMETAPADGGQPMPW